ncbi:hypothetical protein EWM64_g2903 [Hericium alpestre]|uniref:Rhodanese domain-containing protein n=1 Tax=Hericium alpestre TaxID=135208 RepID=A0A4Z0A225_9AGAM|nr:hypothetical protein EWM64_g2903 [Hericium alpestre]
MLSVGTRFNSSQPPLSAEEKAKLKETLDRRDVLQKDWDARELSYDEVKQRSLQPSETAWLIDLDPAKFEQQFGYKKPKLNQEVVFYCRSGKRSSTASDVAKRNGYTNIFNYKGSWLDWVQREGKSST